MEYYNEKWGLSIKRYGASGCLCDECGGMDAAVYFVCVCAYREAMDRGLGCRGGARKEGELRGSCVRGAVDGMAQGHVMSTGYFVVCFKRGRAKIDKSVMQCRSSVYM